MVMSTRQTAVAGQFYPANASEIEATLAKYNKILDEYFQAHKEVASLQPKAVIVPHAGYVYSGFTANVAFRLLSHSDFKHIVVIGPSHRVYLKGTSMAMYDSYATPLGALKTDSSVMQKLKEKFALGFVPEAHHEHSTEVQMPFIKHYFPDASVVEMVYGDESSQNLAKMIEYLLTLSQTAVVISTDLSHFYDINKANKLDTICMDAVRTLDVNMLNKGCEACGKLGVEAMILAAKTAHLQPKLLDYRTSADASGDKSSVVGYVSVAFVEESTVTETDEEKKKVLLKLARESIAQAVGKENHLSVDTLIEQNPWLKEKGAAFVTLNTKEGALRGCIGSLVAHRKLYEDVITNAQNAALHDPRFVALNKDELDNVKVEVSVLTPAQPLEYSSIEDLKSKINVGKDGVVLKHGQYQATFLPQVWEQLPSFELFFAHLCKKAGLKEMCLADKPEISVYHVKKYEE
jgi:AmmeMemoRadiSam system protein B/AmmeMemoRadiSam system protein A